jgi:ketosteroid isomerase-like protein
MNMDRETVDAWLERYVHAWESSDEEAVGALFADDVVYVHDPFRDPIRGRGPVVAFWLSPERRDAPGTFTARYRTIAVEGDLAVAQGRSRYFKDSSQAEVAQEYDNLFVMRFDERGRCASFQEWWMLDRG